MSLEGKIFVMKKGSMQQEGITITSKYTPNNRASKTQKAKSDRFKERNRHLRNNRRLKYSHMTSEQKNQIKDLKKEIKGFNNTINQVYLIDIYKTLHPTTTKCTFFLSAYGTFASTDHIIGHKPSRNKFKRSSYKICPQISMQ